MPNVTYSGNGGGGGGGTAPSTTGVGGRVSPILLAASGCRNGAAAGHSPSKVIKGRSSPTTTSPSPGKRQATVTIKVVGRVVGGGIALFKW